MKNLLLLLLLLLTPLYASAVSDTNEIDQFIDEMVNDHQFDRNSLKALFADIKYRQDIIDAITKPAEGKEWHQYRPIFITQKRIKGGVQFMQQHAETLKRAEKQYGVPPQIITAIIGVETFYGRFKGTYRVADALYTLGFEYPPRATFFRQQFAEFLLMARDEGIDPLTMKGSYAGAMGQPQFIPSSFRAYAVDFDGDGKRDLWNNVDDIIGSVANYFARHHWQKGGAIAMRVNVSGKKHESLLDAGIKPSHTPATLKSSGVSIPSSLDKDSLFSLIRFKQKNSEEYWIGYDNFYVITRYNHSPLYAMAVYQLSEAIRTTLKP